MNTRPSDDLSLGYSETVYLRNEKLLDQQVEYYLNQPDEVIAPAEPEKPKANFWQETGGVLYGGIIQDNIESLVDTFNGISRWASDVLDKHWGDVEWVKAFSDYNRESTQRNEDFWNAVLPKIENQTVSGKIIRGLASFASMFIPISGQLSKAGAFGKVASKSPQLATFLRTTAASAIVTATRDPYEERLSNMIQDTPLANPVTEYLQADPNDSEMEARFKNVVEDIGLGILTEPFEHLVRAVKARKIIRETIPEGADILNKFDDILRETKASTIAEAVEEAKEKTLTYVDELASMKKTTIVPTDLANRTAEELTDIRGFAISRGQEGISQYLENLPKRPLTVNEIIDSGNVDLVADHLELLKVINDLNPKQGIEIVSGPNLKIPFDNQLSKDTGNILSRLVSEEAGGIAPEVLLNPTALGMIGGGVVGGFVDFDGDGNITYKDIGVGILLGSSMAYVGSKVFKGNAKFKAHVKEQITKLDNYETQFIERLKDPGLDSTSRQKLTTALEELRNIKNELQGFKTPNQVIDSVQNPNLSKKLKAKAEPLVKPKETNLTNFVDKIKSGNIAELHKDLNIRFDMVDTEEEALRLIDAVYESFPEEIKKVTREGWGGWDVAKSIADDAGISVEQLNRTFKATNMLDAKILSAKVTLDAAKNRLMEMAQELASKAPGEITDNEILAFRKQASLFSGLQMEVIGMKSEVGRALNSLKIIANTNEVLDASELSRVINDLGGKEKTIQVAKDLINLPSPAKQTQYLKALYKDPSMKFLSSWFYNSLLSNPATLEANAVSGFLTTAQALATTATAEGMHKIFGSSAVDGVFNGETAAAWKGLVESISDAFRLAAKTFKEDNPAFDLITKVDGNAFKASDLVDPATKLGAWLDSIEPGLRENTARTFDVIGNICSYGPRFLKSTDEFWKVITHQMDFSRQCYHEAYKQALEEGLTGNEFVKRVEYLFQAFKNNPEPEMFYKAMQFAREQTFNLPLDPKRNWIIAAGSSVASFTNNIPQAKFLIPFVRTVTNIPAYVAEYTPVLNLTLKNYRDALFHGTLAEKEIAMAKMAVGALLYTVGIGLASKGLITGGGPKDKSAKQLGGWQPYSIKVGDKYFSFNRLDPIGAYLGISADLHEMLWGDEAPDEITMGTVACAVVAALSKNMMSKTYLQSISNIIDILEDPEPYKFQRIAGNTIGAFVPTVVSSVERGIDPAYSEIYKLLDTMKSKIPGVSNSLYPKRNIFGEEVTAPGWSWQGLFNPLTYSEESADPVKRELARLKFMSQSTVLNSMRQIDGVELTPEQRDRYIVLMGEPLKQYLDQLIASPAYQQATDGDEDFPGTKQQMIKQAISVYKQQAKIKILQENPELLRKVQARQQQKYSALTGAE